jgi:RNA polymerase sigma-70 factor (ECF subfamily)
MTHGKLRSVAAKIVKDRSDVEDILQDSYLKIWRKAGQYDPEISSPITWMSRVVTNTALDAMRLGRPLPLVELDVEANEVADTATSAQDRLEIDEQMRALIAAVEMLPSGRKELVKLAYFHGESREALATKFGTRAPTIKTWLRRTLISVRKMLETDSELLTPREQLVAGV